MPYSLNGFPVIVPGSKLLVRGTVPGTTRQIIMRKEVLPLFLALAHDYDDWIRPIDKGPLDDAGYCHRQSRLANGWSSHASGTALDINWSKEGSQTVTSKTFWADYDNHLKAERIKRVYHVVTWGGDWSGKYFDPMHWQVSNGMTIQDVRDKIAFLGITPEGVRHNDWNGKKLKVPRA